MATGQQVQDVATSLAHAAQILREIVEDVDTDCNMNHTEVIAQVKTAYRVLACNWDAAMDILRNPKEE